MKKKTPFVLFAENQQIANIAAVGRAGVTRIVAYDESSQYGFVPWLAVYKDKFCWMRLSAQNVRVIYKEDK